MKDRFGDLRERVLVRAKNDSASTIEKGDKREELVREVLQKMKDEKKILNFMKTTKFGEPDIVNGIDFYIIIMRKKRIVVPIQVTGFYLAKEHKKRHPKIPVIVVFEKRKNVKKHIQTQIEKVLKRY